VTEAMQAQLQRLLDEAEIRSLMLTFARGLDDRDWAAYAGTFAEDGVFEILGQRREGREAIAAGPARDLPRYERTQHFSTNQEVHVDGDEATARSYFIAVHIPDASQPARHADAAGCYECECRRTPDGWKFTLVSLQRWWDSGLPFDIVREPAHAG
jgi:uncharacterized protein (TIGR02246 family)